jgi:FHA domain
MSDPRLCSVHLEAMPRRQEYRRAREVLLGACGQHTLALDARHVAEAAELRDRRAAAGSTPAANKYWLQDRDAVHPLKVGLNTIGRMPDNDVAILDGSVSRRHCAILVHSTAACEVHDTASKNGTFVNGNRITAPTALHPGDEIRLCDHRLVFLADDSEPPALRADDGKTVVD